MTGERSRRVALLAGVAFVLLVAIPATLLLARTRSAPPPGPLFPMPGFNLVDESGRPFASSSLSGQVVVADFIFTRCPTICPTLSARMARLQKRLAGEKPVHLLSFTVDPGNDTPEVLKAYGQKFGQDPARWTFLTGDSAGLRQTIEQGFKIGLKGEGINLTHGDHLVLVDPRGSIRGYYGTDDDDRLARDALALARTPGADVQLAEVLPPLNATLNATSAVCLLLGYRAIRQKRRRVHRRFMLAAFTASALFLVSYLTRFALTGVHRFPIEGGWKVLYFTILGTHTVLAVVLLPMVLRTIYLSWNGRFPEHRRIARFTFPIWVYVSVTGVLVYFLLYQLPRVV